MADNEIDSDYFAICHTNENGTEIECELAITDYARQAAGTVDELVRALEAAEKQISELEAREVKLPKPISVLHRRDFMDAHRSIYAYPEAEVNAALADAGINVAAAGKGEAS